MWPSLSQTKPEPMPLGICCRLRLKRSRSTCRQVTWTTEGAELLYSAMALFSASASLPAGVTGRTLAWGLSSVAGCGQKRQTRNRATSTSTTSGHTMAAAEPRCGGPGQECDIDITHQRG